MKPAHYEIVILKDSMIKRMKKKLETLNLKPETKEFRLSTQIEVSPSQFIKPPNKL